MVGYLLGLWLLVLCATSLPALYKDLPFILTSHLGHCYAWAIVSNRLGTPPSALCANVCDLRNLSSLWERKQQGRVGKQGLAALDKSQHYYISHPHTTRCLQQYRHCCRVGACNSSSHLLGRDPHWNSATLALLWATSSSTVLPVRIKSPSFLHGDT